MDINSKFQISNYANYIEIQHIHSETDVLNSIDGNIMQYTWDQVMLSTKQYRKCLNTSVSNGTLVVLYNQLLVNKDVTNIIRISENIMLWYKNFS